MNSALSLDAIKKMRGGELLATARDALNAQAASVASLEESLIKIGRATEWDAQRALLHDVLCGAALALEAIIAVGKSEVARMAEAKKEGKEPRPMNKAVDAVTDAVRAALIAGIVDRSPGEPAKELEPAA